MSDQDLREPLDLLRAFNATSVDYPRDATLHGLFRRQVAARPDAVAIVHPAGEVTYAALEALSAGLARRLAEAGVRRGDVVALRLPRGLDWIVAMLASLRVGAAYLPIAVREPQRRVAQLLADSNARLVIAAPSEAIADVAVLSPAIGADEARPATEPIEVADDVRATDPAYVMYTSGTTGEPKGVVVTHRNVVRLVVGPDFVDFRRPLRVLQTGAVSFDACTFEVWGTLVHGGTLVLVADDVILDPARLGAALRANDITTLWLTSALFSRLASADPALFAPLRELLLGGDVVGGEHVAKVCAACPGLRVVNGYGPTENTTFSTTHVISVDDTRGPIPIGRPIANSTAYVLDAGQQPLPVGAIGELYVGGDGVALGYLGRSDLTAAAFLPDPFRPGGRMYRTGDLARWRPDGTLDFLGRDDNQVKVRGFRIELGEIEFALRTHPDVSDAVVVVRERGDSSGGAAATRILVGYVASGAPLSARELRAHLDERLPAYAVPGHLAVLDALPLTSHGKIDRAALPDPADFLDPETEYVPARDEAEAELVEIWKAVLDVASLGVLDDLFDLGVDSLAAAALATRINDRFGCSLTAFDVLAHPTIDALRPLVGEPVVVTPAVARSSEGDSAAAVPLTPQQRRLYVEQRKDERSVQYNVPVVVELPADVDLDRLDRAWRNLVARHEALRTVVELAAIPVQRIRNDADEGLKVREGEPQLDELIQPFDLTASLWRACVHVAGDKRSLFVDLHHLVTDGVSLAQLFRDLDALYSGVTLPPVRQYREYVQWLTDGPGVAARDRQRGYWADVFAKPLPTASLPTDRPRPVLRAAARPAGSLVFDFGVARTQALRAFAAAHGVTAFAVLLAAYATVVGAMTGLDDVTVGVPASGRTAAGFDNTVGMFATTVCVRVSVLPHATFADLVGDVASRARGAFAHQDVPIDDLPLPADGGLPFDTMFALQGASLLTAEFLGQRVRLRPISPRHAMFDLNLQVYEEPESLVAEWEYASDIFEPATIGAFRDLLLLVLDRGLANAAAQLGALVSTVDAIALPPTPHLDAADFDFAF